MDASAPLLLKLVLYWSEMYDKKWQYTYFV